MEFIEHPRDEHESFCLIANFFDPHHSFGAPEEFREMIDSDAIPAPSTRADELSNRPPEQLFIQRPVMQALLLGLWITRKHKYGK